MLSTARMRYRTQRALFRSLLHLLLLSFALSLQIASDGVTGRKPLVNSFTVENSSRFAPYLDSNRTTIIAKDRVFDQLQRIINAMSPIEAHHSPISDHEPLFPVDDTPIAIEATPTRAVAPPTAPKTPPIAPKTTPITPETPPTAIKNPPTDESTITLRILIENRLPVNDKFIVRPMGSNLVLTCIVNGSDLTDADRGRSSGMLAIRWYIPLASGHSDSRVNQRRSRDSVQLTISRLRNEDSGNFSCGIQLSDGRSLLKSFKLNVRPGCVASEFQCSDNTCIPLVYKCDSNPDCPDGSDETLNTCGEVVSCRSALSSSVGASSSSSVFFGGGSLHSDTDLLSCGKRCWPRYFCCYHGNCSSGRFINQEQLCCRDLRDAYHRNILNGLDRDNTNIVYHRKYLETAIYTIIGCAVAFILIVSVMIVAFCRVHLRQSAHLSSYSHVRSSQMRHSAAAAAAAAALETDHMLLPPSAPLFEPSFGQAGSRLVVTYNINNGIQVLPCVSPPSYSEAVGVAAATQPPAAARAAAETTTTTTATAAHPIPTPGSSEPAPPQAAAGASGGGGVGVTSTAAALQLVGPPPPYSSCETLAVPFDLQGSPNQMGDIGGCQPNNCTSSPPPLN